jgi:transposase-like protein
VTAAEQAIEDLADLAVAKRSTRSEVAIDSVQRVASRRADVVRKGVPKASAARLLGVSPPTLDKWIARKRISTQRDPVTGRELVVPKALVDLLILVRVLRNAGHRDGVLAAAIERLEQDDPVHQREYAELYGDSIKAMASGDLKPLALPESFGPED